MLALLLDTATLRVLVFGCGTVGKRKANYFEGSVKSVTMAGPETTVSDTEMKSLIDTHDIIVAATSDSECNSRIIRYAKSKGKWYNSATGTDSNFFIPASYTDGDVTVAVSSGGAAPALAVYLRNEIRSAYPGLASMAELQNRIRTELKTRIPESEQRAEILRKITEDTGIWNALRTGNYSEAEKIAWTLTYH